MRHPTQYTSFRRWTHPGSLVHLLFSSGCPATILRLALFFVHNGPKRNRARS